MNGVAEIPFRCVGALVQDLGILMYAIAPEPSSSLAERNFCLAVMRSKGVENG